MRDGVSERKKGRLCAPGPPCDNAVRRRRCGFLRRPATKAMTASLRWDIFCRVVDNFGDAGVCWRLARQLVAEHGLAVTLWIDDVESLARIVPALDPRQSDQRAHAVRVRRDPEAMSPDLNLPDVVIECFGCGLPDAYRDAMAALPRPPVWVNLEYLSAEGWVESAHALPSPHPRLPLTCWFYFPGFTKHTGGLLREGELLAARAAFGRQPSSRAEVWQALGIAPAPDALAVSLFCYTNPALPALLDAWAEGDEPIVCVVPEGVAHAEIDRFTGGAVPHAGMPMRRGRLTLAVAPFVDQDAFDRRLWACDINFVRGEDSFVRAQWAARPLVWHIYPQPEDVHLLKLDAFLVRYEAGLDGTFLRAQRAFWQAWNSGDPQGTIAAWPALQRALPALTTHGIAWAAALGRQTDLATALVNFCESRL
jgi:uncharacterized repeat protein (TIGR03837 family)